MGTTGFFWKGERKQDSFSHRAHYELIIVFHYLVFNSLYKIIQWKPVLLVSIIKNKRP